MGGANAQDRRKEGGEGQKEPHYEPVNAAGAGAAAGRRDGAGAGAGGMARRHFGNTRRLRGWAAAEEEDGEDGREGEEKTAAAGREWLQEGQARQRAHAGGSGRTCWCTSGWTPGGLFCGMGVGVEKKEGGEG